MTTLPLSELLGATVYDPSGAATGRVREVTLAPQEDRDRIASFIVKTKSGNRVLPFSAVSTIDANIHASTKPADWPVANGAEGLFLLERDLLDQQVIDVHGRKVVRVNDVDLEVNATTEAGHPRTVLRMQRRRRNQPNRLFLSTHPRPLQTQWTARRTQGLSTPRLRLPRPRTPRRSPAPAQ